MSKSTSPPPVADTHTASRPADAPKKPWAKPTIRTVDGEVGTGPEGDKNVENANYRPTS